MRRLGLFLLLAATVASVNAATVTLGNVSGNASQTLTNIPVTLQTQGTSIAALQFDVVFDKTAMGITATTGTAASAAAKNAAQNQLATGLRVIIAGLGQDLIGDGTVANLKIVIGAGAAIANYPLTLTNVQASDENGVLVAINGASGNLAVGNPPALSLTKTHTGNFRQGLNGAAYTVTVSNQGAAAATSGTVTMTETVPSGMTLVSMAGTNWDCSGVTTCTRSDALAGGASYPPITVTVDVANNAAASLTNQVAVSGGGSLAGSASDATTINVPLSQAITFAPLSNVTFGAAAFAVGATASSGLPVSFSSSTNTACTLAVNTVTIVGAGTCTIVASQGGDATFAPAASVPQSFTVNPSAQTINFTQPVDTPLNGGPVALAATASSTLAITFTSNTTGVCTVSGSSVTLVTKGTCSITASQAGNANFNAATDITKTFTVIGSTNVITFPQPADTQLLTPPFALTATASSGLTVTYTSNTPAVCTIAVATVSLGDVGSCSITADQAGDSTFAVAASVTRTFNVTKNAQTITFAALSNVVFGASPFTVAATASSTNAVTFSSTTLPVCTVSGTTVTIVAAGSCSINADQVGAQHYLPAPTVTQSFTVTQATQTITFGALSNTTFGTPAFTVGATSSSTLAVSFTSSTQGVCTVSNTTVTLAGVGTCTIVADQAGNGNFSAAASVPQSFTVGQGAQTINFPAPAGVAIGIAPFPLAATASSGLTVTFASTTQSVCTVANSLTVTIVNTGTCSITASQAGNANYTAAADVSQSFTVAAAAQSITFAALPGVSFGASPFTLTATASSGLVVTFASTTPTVCTVTNPTTVTIVGGGNCSITASQAGDTNFGAATPVTRTFAVAQLSQTITFNALPDTTFGTAAFGLTATASSTLAVSYASTTQAVCTVSGSTVTLAGVGTCTITASQAGDANTSAATSVSRSFTVTKGTQTITFATPADVIVGVTPFSVTATSTSALSVTFSGTTPLICTVSGSTVTVVGAGTCSITAAQAGDANYLAATNVVRSFNVAPAPQTITFAALPNVAFGVSPITLTATASSTLTVSFASSTAAVCTVSGTTLTVVGPGNCSVTASQAGTANYTAAPSVTRTFLATGTQTIAFPTVSTQSLGTPPFQLGATSTSGLTVTYASTTQAVCTVSGITVTLVSAGTCTITASQAGNAIFLAATNASVSFTVIPAPACEYNLDPDSASISAAGGQGVFKVLTGPGCAWSATANAGFLTLNTSATGTDSSTFGYSVAANPGSTSRSGTITVSGQTFTVYQFGTSCAFAITPNSLDFTAAGGSALVSVFASAANCTWTSSPGDPAVTLSPSSSTAPSQLTVSLAANQSTSSRSVTATIGGQSLTLNQAGKNCTVALGASAATLPAAGGPGSVDVTTQAGCIYSSVSGPSWINITSGGSGTGPGGTLFYTVDANSTTVSRSAALNIGGQSFQITQAGVSCEISLDTSTLGTPFASAGATGTIGVLASNAACNWTASTPAPWLSFNGPASGTGPGVVSVTATNNAALTSRSTAVTIAGQGVNVTQSGTTCTYILRSTKGSAPATGGSGSVGVVSAGGCGWTSASNDAWLTITGSTNTAIGNVQFTAAANSASTPRSGTLTIAGQTYTVSQAGAPCNFSLALASANIPASGVTNAGVGFTATASGCSANAVSYSGWLTVSTAFSGQAGTITYNAVANTGPARTGIIKLADRTFNVSQGAAACSFTLTSAGSIFAKPGGIGSIPITASSSSCTPAASSDQTWATTGLLTGPVGTVFTEPFTIAPFGSVANAVRTARITLGGKVFTVKQTSW